MNTKINKFLYLGFILLGCVQLVQKSVSESLMNFGIALVFDPFDPQQPWKDRPTWQKLVLIIHLSIVFGLVFIEFFELINHHA